MFTRTPPSRKNPYSFMHSECDFLSEIIVGYLIQKAQEKIIARSSIMHLLWWSVDCLCHDLS